MRITRTVTYTLLIAALSSLDPPGILAQDLNPARVARAVAENNDALRAYSWTLRVEATIGGEETVGLYKVRYDFDGELETTPLGGGDDAELADVLQAGRGVAPPPTPFGSRGRTCTGPATHSATSCGRTRGQAADWCDR